MSYISNLRSKIGHEPIMMVCSSAIIDQHGKILLQLRKDTKTWAIHGGSIELGETIEEAMLREVKEEIGIIPTVYKFFGNFTGKDYFFTYPNGDMVYLVDHIYEVKAFNGTFKENKDEVIELKWFTYQEIPWDNLMHHNKLILKAYLDSKKQQ